VTSLINGFFNLSFSIEIGTTTTITIVENQTMMVTTKLALLDSAMVLAMQSPME
jgi:hypothetical protein